MRSAHSFGIWNFQNKIYVYGGVHDGKFGTRYVSSGVWSFDLMTRYWSEITFTRDTNNGCKRSMCGKSVISLSLISKITV